MIPALERLDDAVTALQRIADALETLAHYVGKMPTHCPRCGLIHGKEVGT